MENYQFQDIVIRFDVFKDGESATPLQAKVIAYDPDKEYILTDFALIKGNEVRYVLDGREVTKIGKYTFVFKARIRELGDYTHIVKMDVKELPVPILD